jgi:hypothetical protein
MFTQLRDADWRFEPAWRSLRLEGACRTRRTFVAIAPGFRSTNVETRKGLLWNLPAQGDWMKTAPSRPFDAARTPAAVPAALQLVRTAAPL